MKQQPRAASLRVDLQNEQVWRNEVLVRLTPKTFAVLRYLLEHPERLITKDELLHTLWPGTVVSEWALTRCIRELRKGLGDEAQAPQYIETVHRRGYRWIAAVQSQEPSRVRRQNQSGLQPPDSGLRDSLLVGRDTEIARLHTWLNKALSGERQVVFVTGEAGIGKTTLVDAFLAQVEPGEPIQSPQLETENWPLTTCLVGRGQCIEHFGAGEAYLPILAALGQLCRESAGPQLIGLLRQQAPTWLVHMPALLDAASLEMLQRQTLGSTQERMLRELAEALEVLTAERGLILFLDDLHWSDMATLDLVAFLARRRQAARLLVIGAYRPVEVIVRAHPLKTVRQELQLHGQCEELRLRPLDEAAVAQYLALRVAAPSLEPSRREGSEDRSQVSSLRELARVIHQRTEGNPLFMVNVVKDLVTQSVLVEGEGQWEVKENAEAVAKTVPENLQQMIEQQIERLSMEEQQVLKVASVAGPEFSAAAVAAGTATTVGEVEEQCERLARREQFLQARGTAEWPDGTVAARYGFGHALYREVVYERIPRGRRVRLHRQIGEREETGYGNRADEIAAELAVHFEAGRDYPRAINYHQYAAQTAIRRSAYQEAMNHLTRGLDLLKTLPDTPDRAWRELLLQLTFGPALMAIKGYAAPEVGKTYARALELCRQVGETQHLFSVLVGLRRFYTLRAEHEPARELEEQLLSLAQSVQDPAFLLEAHSARGSTLLHLGEFVSAQEHLEQGSALYDLQQHRSHAFLYGLDPGVLCLSYAAWGLWSLGYPDQALKRSHEALTLAQELSHPFSLAFALAAAAFLHHFYREKHAIRERVEAVMALATEQGLPFWLAWGTILQGWALAEQGQGEEGIVQIRQGLAAYRATGAGLWQPLFLAFLAETYGKVGQIGEGVIVLAEALAVIHNTGERFWEVALYRLKGELSLKSRQVQASQNKSEITNPQAPAFDPQAEAEAEACFHQAIEIARRQSAKSLELRAAMSLARLWQQQGKKKEAKRMLAKVYGWFTEGFDTKDLQEAGTLLEELGR